MTTDSPVAEWTRVSAFSHSQSAHGTYCVCQRWPPGARHSSGGCTFKASTWHSIRHSADHKAAHSLQNAILLTRSKPNHPQLELINEWNFGNSNVYGRFSSGRIRWFNIDRLADYFRLIFNGKNNKINYGGWSGYPATARVSNPSAWSRCDVRKPASITSAPVNGWTRRRHLMLKGSLQLNAYRLPIVGSNLARHFDA